MDNQSNFDMDMEFELLFYEVLNGTIENLEVLPLPDFDGIILSNEEIKAVKEECDKAGLRLMYRISHGRVATILNRDTKYTGIVPENNSDGFYC